MYINKAGFPCHVRADTWTDDGLRALLNPGIESSGIHGSKYG